MEKISDVSVEVADDGGLYGRLRFVELLAFDDFFFGLLLFQHEIAHLPLDLLLHVECPLELVVAALKLAFRRFFQVHLLVELSFLASKYAPYLLCNNHQGPECFLETVRDRLDEGIRRKHLRFLLEALALEHILPNLIGGHEKAQANCLERSGCGLRTRRGRLYG